MKFKTILLIGMAIALFASSISMAQQPDFLFEQQYPDEWLYAGTHSLEITNGQGETECYFVAACDIATIGYSVGFKESMTRDNIPPARLFKLSPEGELLGEMTMEKDGSIIRLYRDPSNPRYFLSMGTVYDSTYSYQKPYLAKFDLDLNLSWLKEIELPESYHTIFFGGRSLMDSSGNIVFCSWPFIYSDWSNMFYMRLSSEGELLAMGELPQISWMFYSAQGDLFEYEDGSGDYGQTFVGKPEGYNNPPVFFVRMNRDFTDFQTKDLVENIRLSETDGVFIGDYYSQAFTMALPDGSKFMSSRGIRYDGFNPELWDEVIVSMKLDQNDSIVNVSFIPHDNDSVRTMAFCHGIDKSDCGSFYVCNGVYDSYFWEFGEIDGLNRLEVTKTDADANIIWSRCYEDGEHVFHPCSVMATSDDGCLVTGRYWTLDHSVAKVFVLKFFADGTLSVPEMETFVRPYMFYPNPVQDELHLQYSPDVKPTQIELYDLQGRLVHTQKNGLESINMKGLSSGTYTMRVTMEGGRVFTDKVVKE